MTTQPELELARVFTDTGTRKVSSLRPGDWVLAIDERAPCVVLQSSRKDQRIELWFDAGRRVVVPHSSLDLASLKGVGKRRLWWAFLPAWVAKYICPFSAPPRQKKGHK